MSASKKTALLVLDFQTGLADAPFAKGAVTQASLALKAARERRLPVFFSKVGFRPGYPEVSEKNPVFAEAKQKDLFQIGSSQILPELTPQDSEPVVIKSRLNAFTETDLSRMLRAGGIEQLVLAGVSTSGVVLSAFCTTADEDYSLVVLADACADPKQALHDELMKDLFPRSAKVQSASDWIASLSAKRRKPALEEEHMVRAYYLYTADDGNSRYRKGMIALDKVIAAKSVEFKEDPPHSSSSWHNAPTPQYVIFLAGQLEFGSKSGQPLTVNPGEVVIAGDTTGSGHTWRLTNEEPWRRCYVVFEPGAEPEFVEDPAP